MGSIVERPCTVRYRHVARRFPAGTRVRIDAPLFPMLETGTVRAKGVHRADLEHERATCVLPGMLAVTPDKVRSDGHPIDCVALWPHEVAPLPPEEPKAQPYGYGTAAGTPSGQRTLADWLRSLPEAARYAAAAMFGMVYEPEDADG